jgi:uncharacterized repeat protein (TIGR01451 family)
MLGLLTKIVISALTLMASVAAVCAQQVSTSAAAPPQLWNFTKQAFDTSGAPLSGPVAIGQTINYVLSYNPGTTAAGPVTIDDTLSPNLTYVNPSITAPPGWTWTTPPYVSGNHETYSNAGFGPGLAFTLNVPVGDAAASGTSAGDGTLPIPVGNRVYGVLHHLSAGSAVIMCWDLQTLASCGSTWPRSIGSDLMTPTMLRHVVVGTRIYFPTARVAGSTTIPGIGCWDTLSDAPCAFLPLPSGPVWTGTLPFFGAPSSLDTRLAGIAADHGLGRLFMYAADAAGPGLGRVYCVSLTTSCAGWSSPTNLVATPSSSLSWGDMMVEETGGGPATRLYITHSGRVTCLNLTNGSACAAMWLNNLPSPSISGLSLSPVLNSTGNTTQVCLHPIPTGLPACFDAVTGVPWLSGAWPSAFVTAMNNFQGKSVLVAPYRIPGTAHVLYPNGVSSTSSPPSPLCFDFLNGTACPLFSPGWHGGSNIFTDYGYAVDPSQPDNCLLGLGDAGKPWRFTRNGGFGSKGCTKDIKVTFDINSFFCSVKPKDAAWQTVEIIGRPTQLTGGTITLVNSASATVSTITVGSANSYPVSILATGPNSQLTIQFTPTYTGTPTTGYQLQLTFKSDVNPQICYQATVKACGPVSNVATMASAGAAVKEKATAEVNFGDATGEACTPGLLKVCKVAGRGIPLGTPFTFAAGSSTLTVPAGPAPGGTCMVGPSLPVGSAVTVGELVSAGTTVSNISVAPPSQLTGLPNLSGGSVNITMGTGVTEVTFTNKLTGFLEICKKGEVSGNFNFNVNPGGIGPIKVPAGACSPAIEVIAGAVTITEIPKPGTVMSGCSAWPAGQQISCNTSAGTSTVNVAPGNISTMTIAFIENKPVQPH